jgi:hypothetical protein
VLVDRPDATPAELDQAAAEARAAGQQVIVVRRPMEGDAAQG